MTSTEARTSPENVTSLFCNYFSIIQSHYARKMSSTVPLKGKLTVSTRFSKLDSRVAKVETFEFRDARIESRESRIEDRESRNEEFWNIHELEFVRELAIHLSKKDNNYVTQFSVIAHVPSK